MCRHETGSDLGHFLNEVCIIIKYNESFRQEIKDAVIRKVFSALLQNHIQELQHIYPCSDGSCIFKYAFYIT